MYLLTTFLIMEAIAAPFIIFACTIIYNARKREEREAAEALERAEKEEARRSELLETLSAAYRKAKGRGVHNFYLVALSKCCWALRMGEEIDEGAALLALQGIEGDARLDSMVQAILRPGAGE
jgi:hypothetical protein